MLDYMLMGEFGIANKTTFQFESRFLCLYDKVTSFTKMTTEVHEHCQCKYSGEIMELSGITHPVCPRHFVDYRLECQKALLF